jgi:hypothetical protein
MAPRKDITLPDGRVLSRGALATMLGLSKRTIEHRLADGVPLETLCRPKEAGPIGRPPRRYLMHEGALTRREIAHQAGCGERAIGERLRCQGINLLDLAAPKRHTSPREGLLWCAVHELAWLRHPLDGQGDASASCWHPLPRTRLAYALSWAKAGGCTITITPVPCPHCLETRP